MGKLKAVECSLKDFVSCPQFDDFAILKRDPHCPRITIVTPSFNQGSYLEQTILSVLNQNDPNLEYIVMDGGSSDNSKEIIRKYDKYLAYWVSQPDRGQAGAIADGFSKASGEILAYLNSDDVYLPGALEKVREFFETFPAKEFVYGDCFIIDSNSDILRRIYPIEFKRDIFLYENSIIPQPASFWRSAAYRKIGKVNDSLRFCMDYDLWCKFMKAGIEFSRLNDPLAAFRLHDDSKTVRLERIRRAEYRNVIERTVGRRLSYYDYLRIPYLRIKRYCHRPRAAFEGLKTSLWSLTKWFFKLRPRVRQHKGYLNAKV